MTRPGGARRRATGGRRTWRRLRVPLALACAGAAIAGAAAPAPAPVPAPSQARVAAEPLLDLAGPPPPELVRRGRAVFVDTCSSCHGAGARGIPGRGPSLRGAGALAADFHLRTNRMPLDDPGDQPERHPHSVLSVEEKRAVVAFVASFGGPPVPDVDPAAGDVATGRELFTESCAGCHQVAGRGGIVPGAQVPDLDDSAPLDVAEAIELGPFVMPAFPQLERREVDSIAAYVRYTHDPEDRGGWGIGRIGPIPEGLVTWFLGAFALVLVIRIIGERMAR